MTKHRYTDKQILNAIEKSSGLIYLAAKNLGCTPNTIHVRANKNPKIKEMIDIERGRILDYTEAKLIEAVQAGEAWAICFLLKTQGRSRGYVERQEIKAEAKIAITSNVEEITDEQLEFIIRSGYNAISAAKKSPELLD
jgi:hypothetical protein